jgi:hypothetical protein
MSRFMADRLPPEAGAASASVLREPNVPNEPRLGDGAADGLRDGVLLAVLLRCDENPLLYEPELWVGLASASGPPIASDSDKASTTALRRDCMMYPDRLEVD